MEQLYAGSLCAPAESGASMIVATRTLKLRTGNSVTDVVVGIHAPTPKGMGWTCSFEIAWPGGTDTSHAMGADAIQALRLAMEKIAAQLYATRHHSEGRLTWMEPGRGYGFPLHPNSRDLAIGDDKLL